MPPTVSERKKCSLSWKMDASWEFTAEGPHLQKEAAVTAFGTVENEFDAFQVIWTWLGGAKRAQR